MDYRLHGLMLGCAAMLSTPSAPIMAQQFRHAGVALAAAAAVVGWRDLRIGLVCSEGNPTAHICLRSDARRPLRGR